MHIRKWLNPKGTAFVEVISEYEDDNYDAGYQVKIADCNRIVTLEFDFYGNTVGEKNRKRKARLRKVNILIDVLSKLKEKLEIPCERVR